MIKDIITILQTDDPLTTLLALMVFVLAGVIWYLYRNTVPLWAYKDLKKKTKKHMQISREISQELSDLSTIIDERL